MVFRFVEALEGDWFDLGGDSVFNPCIPISDLKDFSGAQSLDRHCSFP
jgi:hypothetical protein